MNSPQQVIENFILWYTSDETERDQLQQTIDDPAIYLHHDETSDDHDRISNNIMNVLTWVNRNWSKQDKTYLNLLRCVADYFQEDHVDGWESFSPEPETEKDITECLEAFKTLDPEQAKEVDEIKFHILSELRNRLTRKHGSEDKTVKAFRATYNYLSVKKKCLMDEAPIELGKYTIPTGELIPFPDSVLAEWLDYYTANSDEAQYGGQVLNTLMDRYDVSARPEAKDDNWWNDVVEQLKEIREKQS